MQTKIFMCFFFFFFFCSHRIKTYWNIKYGDTTYINSKYFYDIMQLSAYA